MSEIQFIFSSFDNLTSSQLEAVFNLRQRVFIIEQQCFYEDIDGSDSKADHLLLFKNGTLAGYLRIFKPGLKFVDASSLGRIVVDTPFRGSEIGKELIRKGVFKAKELFPSYSIKIEAQAALDSYYTQFGFSSIGEIYSVDDIPHQLMILEP
ncbi:MAG: GNAT family N-acetyltransferase [Balneolaceae bacterium]